MHAEHRSGVDRRLRRGLMVPRSAAREPGIQPYSMLVATSSGGCADDAIAIPAAAVAMNPRRAREHSRVAPESRHGAERIATRVTRRRSRPQRRNEPMHASSGAVPAANEIKPAP